MKTIAVATDLSARADRAVARAFELAAALDARLYVFSVIDDQLPEAMQASAATATEDSMLRLCGTQPATEQVDWTAEVLRGTPDEALREACSAKLVDLVVLGLHRHRPLMDLIRETTMERLTRKMDLPVLIVRDLADRPYQSVLAALDFAPAATAALRTALVLAPGASYRAIHAVNVPYQGFVAGPGLGGDIPPMVDPTLFLREAENQKQTWCAANPDLAARIDVQILEGALHAVIAEVRTSAAPDLIVLGAHSRALPMPWLMGSIANEMMRDPPCDSLIVPLRR